ncbi:MAG: glutamate synthase subunit beta [Spirochaetales bacterium]|nr:glutamate synthase subunit beta [Spirochaetales bacterium]
MGKQGGFLEYDRTDPVYREPEERVRDFREVERMLDEETLHVQAARCMECGTPFCHGYGCPVENIIPEMNELVYRKKWREGIRLILSTNPFPEFTGRICPALCETSCVLAINDDAVTIRQIELALIEKGFREGYIFPEPPAERNGLSVAVVGSGPAGLAAALFLNRAGYTVTVFEKAHRAGGILRYGIPDFKLEKNIVERRVDLMKAEGIVFETGIEAGTDISFHYLESRYDAICLACGAEAPRDIDVPGRNLDGIHFAMEYLIQQNRRVAGEDVSGIRQILATGKKTVVIGGGDTGADCLGTAIRQRAARIHQLEILPEPPAARSEFTPWPKWPYQLRESSSHKEGGTRLWSVKTTGFSGKKGKLTGLQAVRVEWSAGENGLPARMKEKPGTEFDLEADLVILAMGFSGHGNGRLVESMGIEVSPNGFIKTDEEGMTNVKGVFSAGDMASGPSLVVRAIEAGKRAAEGIIKYVG